MESIRIDWPIVYLLCNTLSLTARQIYWTLLCHYRDMEYEEVMDILGIRKSTFFLACQELEMYNLAERHKKKRLIRLSDKDYFHLQAPKDMKYGSSTLIDLRARFNEKKYVSL